ncbi:MAG TPA: hypothetical protein ENJ18_06165 [Nannocystis exedens]|nr:hypothetical protein [Nannocystis exedens]
MSSKIFIAGFFAIALVLAARTGYGQPAAIGEHGSGDVAADDGKIGATADAPTKPPASTDKGEQGKKKVKGAKGSSGVGKLRSEMEGDLAEIGKIAKKVRRDGDMVKIACVTDKQDRAEGVMDVATPEIALLQGETGQADPVSQSFAGEKLEAAALRLGKLLAEARACTGTPAKEGHGDGENIVDEGDRLPPRDPTASPGYGPGSEPPSDPTRAPVASPVR